MLLVLPEVQDLIAEDLVGLRDLLVGRKERERPGAIIGEARLLFEHRESRGVPRLDLGDGARAVDLLEVEVRVRPRSGGSRRRCETEPTNQQPAYGTTHSHFLPYLGKATLSLRAKRSNPAAHWIAAAPSEPRNDRHARYSDCHGRPADEGGISQRARSADLARRARLLRDG